MNDREPAFGIYVHWPFCLSKCPYCDFNSHVEGAVDHGRWRDALLLELSRFAAETEGRAVTSVFFGGGTPSLMDPGTVAAVIDSIGEHWSLAPDAEITLEANPTSVEAGRFAALRRAGVNRVSLGVQSLEPDALSFLGRKHSIEEAMHAVGLARTHFPRFSFDLIYGRPGQTGDSWQNELLRALEHAGEHLSLYQLTIEPGTQFHRDRITTVDDDAGAEMYERTQRIMEDAGLPAYEISNHARPGAECRHNLLYWRGGDYVGVGPGAHGRLSNNGKTETTYQARDPAAWLTAAEKGDATAKRTILTSEERRHEVLLMGLRLREGIAAVDFKTLAGSDLVDALDAAALDDLCRERYLAWDGKTLRATPEGTIRLDSVLAALAR